MREMNVGKIRDTVADLCLKANFELRKDVLRALRRAAAGEPQGRARGILRTIIENARIAKVKRLAICQDTGVAVVFLEIGQEVTLTGGDLERAVNDGVKEGYRRGYLRKSVVSDPFTRKNTGDNTPAVIHVTIVPGDRVRVTVMPKGFGSENKSAVVMLAPADGEEAIKKFIIETVRRAGADACPPLIIGIGIGGTMEHAAFLAKKALLRPIDARNPKRYLAALERELTRSLNALKIGPMGLGGRTTVLGVKILDSHTHIAGLPVAVNVSCHATRSAEKTL